MRAKGFGDQYVRRYRMVTAFHMQRRPLIVFICGTACTGGWCFVPVTASSESVCVPESQRSGQGLIYYIEHGLNDARLLGQARARWRSSWRPGSTCPTSCRRTSYTGCALLLATQYGTQVSRTHGSDQTEDGRGLLPLRKRAVTQYGTQVSRTHGSDQTEDGRGLLPLRKRAVEKGASTEVRTQVSRFKVWRAEPLHHTGGLRATKNVDNASISCCLCTCDATRLLTSVLSSPVQLLRTTGMTTLDASPLWDRAELSSDDLLAEYQRECGIVRRGINGDLTKVGSAWCRGRW